MKNQSLWNHGFNQLCVVIRMVLEQITHFFEKSFEEFKKGDKELVIEYKCYYTVKPWGIIRINNREFKLDDINVVKELYRDFTDKIAFYIGNYVLNKIKQRNSKAVDWRFDEDIGDNIDVLDENDEIIESVKYCDIDYFNCVGFERETITFYPLSKL